MDRLEQDFLSGALTVGDPVLERRLLGAFHVIVAASRIADGDPVDIERAVGAARSTYVPSDFADSHAEFEQLSSIEHALTTTPLDRAALYAAVVGYGRALCDAGVVPCALATFSLTERLWTIDCRTADRLLATFRYALLLCRGARPLADSRDLPVLLALRARAAKSRYYLGLARYLRVERAAMSGNLSLARALAGQLLAWGRRRDMPAIEGWAHLVMAVVHGRAGEPGLALRHAAEAYDARVAMQSDGSGALLILANALADLRQFDDARDTFEVVLLAARPRLRHGALMGLMDLAVRRHDHAGFTALHERLARMPMSASFRLVYLREAALGMMHFGDTRQARALLETGHQLAHRLGYGYDYLQADAALEQLSRREAAERLRGSSQFEQDVVARVLADVTLQHSVSSRAVSEALA